MPGREGQGNDPWNWSPPKSIAASNGTGKKPAVPHRPPGLTRIDNPPVTPRVARPQRKPAPVPSWRRRLLILLGVFIVCGLLAWGIGYAFVNVFIGINASTGASQTAADFLAALSSQNYNQAYQDLDATITVQLTPEEFTQQAQQDDRCFGKVTGFSEVEGSATGQNNTTQSFTYNITRSNLSKTYQLRLTLQKDSDGDWNITSYGNSNDLGPGQPCS